MRKINYFSNNWLAIKVNNAIIRNLLRCGNITGVVYDLGCGERPYENDILKKAEKYVGVDWNGTLHNLKADVVADLNKKLPIETGSADTVTSFQVLEHLCEPQIFLNESYRILKEGGKIIITVPFQWWVHEVPFDYFRYTPYGLKYIFNKAGFGDVEIRPTSGFFTMWVLKINYFSARLLPSSKRLRWLRALLVPGWFFAQLMAPILDKLDKYWSVETISYVVIAKK